MKRIAATSEDSDLEPGSIEERSHKTSEKKPKKRKKAKHRETEGWDKLQSTPELGTRLPGREKKPKRKRKHAEVEDFVDTGEPAGDGAIPMSLLAQAEAGVGILGRYYTVSIALPGSIIDNAQTLELKSYLAGQIARAAAVFNIDEIVIFDEMGSTGKSALPPPRHQSDPNIFLARILQYLETPQYLRKLLFPMHPDLKFAGLLNPLDCPHHMRIDEESEYREGVVVDRPVKASGKKGSFVECGMRKTVQIDKQLQPGVRVTVKLHKPKIQRPKYYSGHVVSPSAPRTESGSYWGYTVRFADSLGAIFTEAPFKGCYDLTIGTSERGDNIDSPRKLPEFRHLLVVFGGLKGLEYSLECDDSLHINDVSLLFDHYLNTCPNQGSRTIRTEEAVLISLSALRCLIVKAGTKIPL